MRTRLRLLVVLFVFSTCGVPLPAIAQQETARLTGTVRDPGGAAVPGATVTVKNVRTNVTVTAQTDSDGIYTIPSLRPGEYTITAEGAGFAKSVRTGITLQVAQVAQIDVTMQAGALSETIEVTGATPLLETATSSRALVIDQQKIVELPLNGRDYNQLALLAPGVLATTPRLASVNFKGAMNVNGNRTFNNVFLLDGVDNISYSNSFRGENVQLVQPSIEALQEFKIQTNAYSAEFGRSSGAVVNATSTEEVNGYSAAGSLMATYFGCLETAAQWMVDQGAEYGRARTYLSEVFFGLAQTAIKSHATFETLVGAHSVPQGLNEQAYRVFAGSGGTDALVAAMESVATRIASSFTERHTI